MSHYLARYAVALTVVVGACSSPTDTKNSVVIDDDMGANNGADVRHLDVNNMPGDLPMTGCLVDGCPDTQVCNTQTGSCVDCLTNAECGANGLCDPVSNKCSCGTGFHRCDGACSPNDSVDTCGSSCTPCPTDPNGTATCDGTQCGLSCAAPLMVDPATNRCVGCTANADCTGGGASVCGAGGACESCTVAADCTHIANSPVCADGRCVACSSADESPCGANSCDSFTGQCTTTPRSSVDECEPCLADSECMRDHACIAMNFQGDARSGGFCLPLDLGGCVQPFPVSVTRTSLSGAPGDYCTLNEARTTCEGLADYYAPCGSAADCGADGLDDGICEAVDFEFAKCTFLCDTSEECPSTSLIGCATGDVGKKWCGAF